MTTKTTKQNTKPTTEQLDAVEAAQLDNVTGGCSACGCGQPDAPGQQQQAGRRFGLR
jgi:hypothetical protein